MKMELAANLLYCQSLIQASSRGRNEGHTSKLERKPNLEECIMEFSEIIAASLSPEEEELACDQVVFDLAACYFEEVVKSSLKVRTGNLSDWV